MRKTTARCSHLKMPQAIRYIPTYTVADYERWEGEWELWDGVPVAMSSAPIFRHQ